MICLCGGGHILGLYHFTSPNVAAGSMNQVGDIPIPTAIPIQKLPYLVIKSTSISLETPLLMPLQTGVSLR